MKASLASGTRTTTRGSENMWDTRYNYRRGTIDRLILSLIALRCISCIDDIIVVDSFAFGPRETSREAPKRLNQVSICPGRMWMAGQGDDLKRRYMFCLLR